MELACASVQASCSLTIPASSTTSRRRSPSLSFYRYSFPNPIISSKLNSKPLFFSSITKNSYLMILFLLPLSIPLMSVIVTIGFVNVRNCLYLVKFQVINYQLIHSGAEIPLLLLLLMAQLQYPVIVMVRNCRFLIRLNQQLSMMTEKMVLMMVKWRVYVIN